ncbi:MAG: Ger(x)C family spore germination C-terminal domain-containing protein [Clostridia bacterium]
MLKKNILLTIKVIICILVIFFMINLDNTQRIEHSTFVSAIGIDKSKNENKILVTYQIVPPQITNESTPDLDKYSTTTVETETMEEAVAIIHNYISTVVNFSHARAIIFSKEIAELGCIEYINSIVTNPTYNSNMFVMVCSTSAQKYLESMSKDLEVNPILYYNVIRNANYISSSIQPVTAIEFLRDYYLPNVNPIATMCSVIEDKNKENTKDIKSVSNSSEKEIDNIEKKDGNIEKKSKSKIEAGGMAIFDKDKLIGTLNLDETAYYLMINSKLRLYNTNTKIDKFKVGLLIRQKGKTNISVCIKEENPVIKINVPLQVSVAAKDEFYTTYVRRKRKKTSTK